MARKEWEASNKPHVLTKLFFSVRRQPAFCNRKPTQDFFRVYGFFKKIDESSLNLLWEYLQANPNETIASMSCLFQDAKRWASQQKIRKIDTTKVADYLQLIREMKV